MTPRLAVAAVGITGVLAVACGGGSAPEPTPTPTQTPAPPATPAPSPTVEARQPEPEATVEEVRCPDPYPGGAPYEPEPGEPPRLRPTGSPPAIAPYTPLPFSTDPELEDLVRDVIRGDENHYAIVIKNIADGRGVMIAPDRSFYAASLFKTWVMLEAFHQRAAGLLDFAETYLVSDYYRQFSLNPGEVAACEPITVDQALRRGLTFSDNVAANMLLDRLGPGNVNAALDGFGLTSTEVAVDGSLPTTARDTARLLEAIARGAAVSESASDQMVSLLTNEAINDRLPALLPEGTVVAHKTGNWENATHDAGIIYSPDATYVMVVLTDFGFSDNPAERIAQLSRGVYSYFNPP